jgi:carbon-monoxide dehydrogenase medium subunit
VKPAPFDYERPRTLAQASAALNRAGVASAAIAGGQSLMPMLALRLARIDLLVDLSRLEELKESAETATGLRIGALTSHAAIEDGKVPDLFAGLLRHVARGISYRAVRNHGTIGGSVALADPAADWPCCLMALGAVARIAGSAGERREPVAELVQGAYATSLASGEILLGFEVPRPQAPLAWGFAKVVRKSGAFASSLAIATRQGRDSPVSVVLAAAGPCPVALPATSRSAQAGVGGEAALREAIAADLAEHAGSADAYQRRLHTATILRALSDLRSR